MAVYKRGERWFVKFQIKNMKVWKTIPEARTKAQAQRAEALLREQVYANKYGQKLAPLFSEFVEAHYRPWAQENKRSYKTAEAVHLTPLLEFFGGYRLSEISMLLVESYKKERRGSVTKRKTTRAPSSVNRELEVLSGIFTLAIENDKIGRNPCSKVKKLRECGARERYLSEDEEQRLMVALESSPVHLKRFVILALETGLRKGELLGLTTSQVVLNHEIRIVQSKTGKRKTIPLSSRATSVLLEMVMDMGIDAILPGGPKRFFKVDDVKKSFASACRRADVEDFRIHDLRHTAATRWRQAGADEFTVMRLLGHTRLDTSAIYAHSTSMEMRKIVENAQCAKEPLQFKKEA